MKLDGEAGGGHLQVIREALSEVASQARRHVVRKYGDRSKKPTQICR